MLEHLNKVNSVNHVRVHSVWDSEFASYGRVVTGYDFSPFTDYLTEKTGIPETGNVYVASVPEMEAFPAARLIQDRLYGEIPIQIGYCNGRNTTYNGFEFHKDSEINIAATDFMLVLGHTWEITGNTYRVEDAKVFFVEKGAAIEMYQTTLHLSPCRVTDDGFRGVVILPRGTNTPLEHKGGAAESEAGAENEAKLLLQNGRDWILERDGQVILESTERSPLIYVGCGQESVDIYRGNYKIEDYVIECRPLTADSVTQTDGGLQAEFGGELSLTVTLCGDCAELRFTQKNPKINRVWFRDRADKDERCYGCGEQMSYFNLHGRHFPLWSSEPGVGRDKTTYITWRSDVENKAGGDYYNTYFPQPAYVSSRRYYLHVDSSAYADFDFRNPNFHELQIWEVPSLIRIEAAPTLLEVLEKESAFFGRQPELPEWVYNGLIIGVQGGNGRSFGIMEKTLEHGIKVSGVWCQDWVGKRITSFGKRLQWDWHFSQEMYPDLPKEVEKLHQRGIKFLGYINPYLVCGGKLYQEGMEKDVFAKKSDGSVYLVDFGEFDCAIPDLTDPKAYEWFKNRAIKECSLDIGIDGWMADFGEYLPTDDIVLHSGRSPMLEHNNWPALWAKCNYEALQESGKLGEAVYFMRAGFMGSQKYCTLLWQGDQSVDFSIHDGLASVMCGALSTGMTGCGLSHSDIGGYTSLFGNTRTKELFLRWAEMAAFTPVMRTHECNRPEENFQYYDDGDCMEKLARLVDVYTMLAPYTRALVAENAPKGIPIQCPMILHNEDDPRCYEIQYQYLFGPDMLVVPVYLSE